MHVYSLLWVHVWITSFYNRPMLGVFNLDALHDLLSVGFIDLLVFLFMQYNLNCSYASKSWLRKGGSWSTFTHFQYPAYETGKALFLHPAIQNLVEPTGFEPVTFCLPDKRSTK